MPKTKSAAQVRYLLSDGSPLDNAAKSRLKRELHSGAIKIVRKRKVGGFKMPRKRGGFY